MSSYVHDAGLSRIALVRVKKAAKADSVTNCEPLIQREIVVDVLC
jgi:hypothetical protein